MRTCSVFILLLLIIYSCKESPQNNNSVNGVWESIGSGWVLHIQDSLNYSFYDITSISCISNRQGNLNELSKNLSLKNDTLSLLKGVITYKFARAEQLPKICTTKVEDAKQNDPLYNFDVFAETVEKHYAFMELNNIDWKTLHSQQRSTLNKKSTDAELYLAIETFLEKLNDNHAYLEANDAVYDAVEKLTSIEEIETEETLLEYGDFVIAKMVAEHHLQEEMTKDSWLIQWGKLNDDVGYIQIKSMWLYADLDIPKTLIDEIGYVDAYVETFYKMYEGDYIEKEKQGVQKIMNTLMTDLFNTKSIVIDVRFNGGGQDAVSFEILSRFIPEKLQIATQKLKYKNSYTDILPLYIEGVKNAYTKPVYVLTSQQTGSAAEAFAIATMPMKNVKRIGSPTSGAMSTALEKTLPNGWTFSISNEVYMDNQGYSYENKGVPVDYNLNYPKDRQTFFRNVANNLKADKQNILQAIEVLKEQ